MGDMKHKGQRIKIASVEVDQDRCFSHGTCLDIAPQIFRWDEDSISQAGEIGENDEAIVWEAAECCPVLAIVLKDKQGNQIYPPEAIDW